MKLYRKDVKDQFDAYNSHNTIFNEGIEWDGKVVSMHSLIKALVDLAKDPTLEYVKMNYYHRDSQHKNY